MNTQLIKRRALAATCIIVLLAVLVGIVSWAGSYYPAYNKDSKNHLERLRVIDIYENPLGEAIPQTVVYGLIKDHFANAEKTPKLLFIGYDGAYALLPALNYGDPDSAISAVAAEGGLYLTYCGGATKGAQDTSTAPGWAATFTGVWATENGVYSNLYTLNKKTESIIYQLGKQGKKTSFSTIWGPHFTRTYKNEVAAAKANNYPIEYILNEDDDASVDSMLAKINAGYDAIFGILEYTDRNGHGTGFSIDNPKYVNGYLEGEKQALKLFDAVKARETYEQEDWLIIITSDHGGYGTSHGSPSPMETYIFLATNKKLP